MNILFFHGDETCPTMGGIQRTTAIVAEGLKTNFGHKCYNIFNYANPYPEDVPRYKYEVSERMPLKLDADEVAEFIKKYKIDAIVNQMAIPENSIFRKAISKSGRNCRLFYFHHNTPRRLWDLSFAGAVKRLMEAQTFKARLKSIIAVAGFPIYREFLKQRTLTKNATDYRRIHADADSFVLLSTFFNHEWEELTRIRDTHKLKAIPNARSFDRIADEEIIENKEKRVLIVARMVEFPKQIKVALKIWQSISKDERFLDWKFDVVGTGKDLDSYKRYVSRHDIPRVKFWGRQESMLFYEKSSIFLMPSIREGWPMTLMEAMQMGCVPVAFDSFGSVREIIENGETGFLVKPFDKTAFKKKVKLLMSNDELRRRLALNAVKSTDRFTKEKVLSMWQDLLTSK